MTRLPFVFQNVVRKRYFDILKIFIEDEGLILDVDNYKNDVIIDRRYRINPTGIIAFIDSHSAWGEPDDLTNERIVRKYNGLMIIVLDEDYMEKVEKVADKLMRNLQESVSVRLESNYFKENENEF